MVREISERDWKVFRELRPIALDRFCERVLADLGSVASEAGKSAHERYLAVFQLFQSRDEELVQMFDTLRRSTALLQIAAIRNRGLMTDQEFSRFSPETRDVVETFLRR